MKSWFKQNATVLFIPLVVLIGDFSVTQYQVTELQKDVESGRVYVTEQITEQYLLKEKMATLEETKADKGATVGGYYKTLDRIHTVESSVATLQGESNRQRIAVRKLDQRVSGIEIASAQTQVLLGSVAEALTEQTKATTKLTEQVIRLEERIK